MMAENVARVFTHRVIRTQLPGGSLGEGPTRGGSGSGAGAQSGSAGH